jgi:hypothetical protein
VILAATDTLDLFHELGVVWSTHAGHQSVSSMFMIDADTAARFCCWVAAVA